jgi:hypothetical protein
MIDQLDACTYLFLCGITEPNDNSLQLLIEEARASDTPEDIEILGVKLEGTRSIEHDEVCRVFEVYWENYISYSVTNESYANADAPDSFVGQRVRYYSSSPFLEYIRHATFASDEYPGPYKHIAILCENHIIDVASMSEPQVRLVKAGRPRVVNVAQQRAPTDTAKRRG